MRNSLMRKSEIVKGSLTDVAKQSGTSLAESFVSADAVVIVDTSGSMSAEDTSGGLSRYDVACKELEKLQETLPGKIAVISFSNSVVFCPNGQPYNFGGGTDLAKALEFTKLADVDGMRFVLISDGEPNDRNAALRVAKTYANRIDVIYVGGEFGSDGRRFLNELAQASGGIAVPVDTLTGLGRKTQLLLAA